LPYDKALSILIETPEANLSRAIQWLNVSYATYLNYKRDRQGHLFQGRFKAILVDVGEYLKHLSRYIHLNLLRAKMAKHVAEHEWCSYTAFIGKIKAPVWLSINWMHGKNGPEGRTAAARLPEVRRCLYPRQAQQSKIIRPQIQKNAG
jgi:hypothetical protein